MNWPNWTDSPRFDEQGCAFCDIVHGRAHGEIAHNWPEALAIQPLNPVTDGHILVIPKAHVRDFTEDPVVSAMITQRVVEAASWTIAPGVNVITSIGSLATQSIFHLHVHIVPRREDDGLKLPWSDHA